MSSGGGERPLATGAELRNVLLASDVLVAVERMIGFGRPALESMYLLDVFASVG
jgi:hypothetical protein